MTDVYPYERRFFMKLILKSVWSDKKFFYNFKKSAFLIGAKI